MIYRRSSVQPFLQIPEANSSMTGTSKSKQSMNEETDSSDSSSFESSRNTKMYSSKKVMGSEKKIKRTAKNFEDFQDEIKNQDESCDVNI